MAKKDLTNIPTVEITEEIRRRQRRLPTLKKKREKLLAQIREIEEEMAEAKNPPGASARAKAAAATGAGSGRRGAPRGLRSGSMPQLMLSYIVGQGPAGATSEDIHRQFSEQASSVSVPLQTLKKRGLVEAEKPTGGGRGYIYTATREGKAALKG